MDLSPDTLLRNRYRIIRLLGQGGMGAVYLAYDLSLEHEVAVKINRNSAPQAASQFIAEARLLASLRHPNLPRVIDYFLEGTNQFLVMDYIAGDDLKSLVEQYGAMAPDQVLQWANQLGSALDYLHRQTPPVFHRDVKPSNLKLSPENEVVLVDFGIAKAAEVAQATAAGATGYTPGYAPPEQYGTGRTGPYSDQYAMAATLYHLMTGQKPVDALQRVLGQASLPPAQAVTPGIPAHVSLALEQAMAVRPEDRFATVEDFVRALQDEGYQATIRINPAQAVMPTLNTDATVAAYPVYQPPLPPPPVAPPARRASWGWWIGGGLLVLIVLVGLAWALLKPGGLAAPTPLPTVTLPVVAVTSTPTTLPASATPVQTASFTPSPSATYTLLPPTATFTLTPTLTYTPAPSATPTQVLLGKGRSIAFVSDRGDGKTLQVWTMKVALNAQGQAVASDYVQLTSDPGDKQQPAWSPDGNKLLYVGPGGKGPKGEDYGLDIFMLDLTQPGAKPVNLTHRLGDDTEPAWSPDGKLIAFTNNGRGDKVRMIDMMNADGSDLHRISVDLEEFMPAWSPDGQWLFYVVLARENNILYRRSKVDNFVTFEFFDNKAISGRTGQVADPAWAPDGSRIAYVQLQLQNEGKIMSMDAATRGDKIISLTATSIDRQPAWSPDSQWIVFCTRRDGNPEIYLLRSTGQDKPFNLTNAPARDFWPAWQP